MVFPTVFCAAGESNPFLRRYKSSLEKRLSITRMKELFEEVDLAVYLMALNRPEDALAVLRFLTESVPFRGDYNIWTPIGYGLVLRARLEREISELHSADFCLSVVKLHPINVSSNSKLIQDAGSFGKNISEALNQQSPKWACQTIARLLYKICYFRDIKDEVFSVEDLQGFDLLIIQGFRGLRQRLTQGEN